jgi:hypothetical protein
MVRLLLLSLLSTLAACVIGRQETNEPLDPVVVQTLRPGTTTARQVTERLGAPTEVVQLGRRVAYRYDAGNSKSSMLILLLFNMIGEDTRSDRLWVFFDDRDVLTHYGVSYATHRTQYALPWEDVHEPYDNAVRDSERAGLGGAARK